MRKIRKNLFMALSFAMAISAIGVATSLNFTSETAAANTVAPLYVKEGASIRKDVTTDENGNVVVGSGTGIRYTAVASADLVQSLVETTDGVTTYKEGAKLGMFIVPKKAIDKYEAQKDAEGGENDYFKYFNSVNSAITEDVISYVCKAEHLDATTENEYKVAIVDIETENYTEDYQAVAYYVLNGKYYYSAKGDVRSVAYVADKALLSTEGDNDTNDKTALGNIIERYIALSNGEEGKYEKTVATLASFDLKETYAAPINATDLTYTVAENETDVSINGTKLTGLSTDGAADVQITAYDGYVDFTLKVTTKAEKGETKTLKSSHQYTVYGGTTGTITNAGAEGNTYSGVNALNNIQLGIGTSESSDLTKMTTTNLPYIDFSYKDSAYTTGFTLTVEFTGNNMPMISYFAEKDSETAPMQNVVDRKGILITNGFKLNADTSAAALLDRLNVFGHKNLTNNTMDKDNGDASVGELDKRLVSVKSVENYMDTEENSLNISYNELSENPNQRYRLFVRVQHDTTSNKVTLQIALFTIGENDYNGELKFYYANKKLDGPAAGEALSGNIVLYGRPYQTTTLDRVYLLRDIGSYVENGVNKGQIALFDKPAGA